MKITPSLIGLSLEVVALALIFSLMLFEKSTQTIFYISIIAIIIYLAALYHFKFEKHKARKQV